MRIVQQLYEVLYKHLTRGLHLRRQICKQAFANIHAITFKKIRMLSQKLDQNIMFPRDQRGKHMNRRKISEQIKGEQVDPRTDQRRAAGDGRTVHRTKLAAAGFASVDANVY